MPRDVLPRAARALLLGLPAPRLSGGSGDRGRDHRPMSAEPFAPFAESPRLSRAERALLETLR